jgi:ArsR family transcriptional regulator
VTVLESQPRLRQVTCCGLATSPVTPADAERLAPMFKALGDPARLRMASMIAAKPEVCVCEITPAFELSSGTISHHLKTLREAGLVDCERRGTFVYYWINPAAISALSALLSP